MEDFSVIFDLVQQDYVRKWDDEIEYLDLFVKEEEKLKKQLLDILGEENKELLRRYAFNIENKIYDKNLRLSARIMNLGMKMGYEMGSIFAEIDYKNR